MSSEALFANDAFSTLAGPINNVATALTVPAGQGARFPNPGAGQYFIFTLIDAATGNVKEICHCTTRVGDTFTVIVRAQEGTVAQNWNTGDLVQMLCTAGTQGLFAQPDDLQLQANNYGEDTGAGGANAIVVPAPATQPATMAATKGVSIRIKKGAAVNTGATTLAWGALAAAPVVLPGGAALSGGELPANGIATYVSDGTNWELQTVAASGGGGVPPTRQINTINGLTGGGDLSANRTLQPVYGSIANTVCEGNDPRLVGGGVFRSAQQNIVNGGGMAFAHGLTLPPGAPFPETIQAFLINTTPEGGYALGDGVEVGYQNGFGGSNERGVSVGGSTTQVFYSIVNNGISIPPKGGGAPFNITNANWQILMTARP